MYLHILVIITLLKPITILSFSFRLIDDTNHSSTNLVAFHFTKYCQLSRDYANYISRFCERLDIPEQSCQILSNEFVRDNVNIQPETIWRVVAIIQTDLDIFTALYPIIFLMKDENGITSTYTKKIIIIFYSYGVQERDIQLTLSIVRLICPLCQLFSYEIYYQENISITRLFQSLPSSKATFVLCPNNGSSGIKLCLEARQSGIPSISITTKHSPQISFEDELLCKITYQTFVHTEEILNSYIDRGCSIDSLSVIPLHDSQISFPYPYPISPYHNNISRWLSLIKSKEISGYISDYLYEFSLNSTRINSIEKDRSNMSSIHKELNLVLEKLIFISFDTIHIRNKKKYLSLQISLLVSIIHSLLRSHYGYSFVIQIADNICDNTLLTSLSEAIQHIETTTNSTQSFIQLFPCYTPYPVFLSILHSSTYLHLSFNDQFSLEALTLQLPSITIHRDHLQANYPNFQDNKLKSLSLQSELRLTVIIDILLRYFPGKVLEESYQQRRYMDNLSEYELSISEMVTGLEQTVSTTHFISSSQTEEILERGIDGVDYDEVRDRIVCTLARVFRRRGPNYIPLCEEKIAVENGLKRMEAHQNDSITVILTQFKRNTTELQLRVMLNQSVSRRIRDIIILQDLQFIDLKYLLHSFPTIISFGNSQDNYSSAGQNINSEGETATNQSQHLKIHIFHSKTRNFKYHGRFALPLLLRSDFVAIIDDDTIPGLEWLESAVSAAAKYDAVVGPQGLMVDRSKQFMVAPPSDYDFEVDYLGRTWIFHTDYIRYFWSERVPSWECCEDIAVSSSLWKQRRIRSMVPAQPLSQPKLWGDTDGRFHHDGNHTYKDIIPLQIRWPLTRYWLESGWVPIILREGLIENSNFCLSFPTGCRVAYEHTFQDIIINRNYSTLSYLVQGTELRQFGAILLYNFNRQAICDFFKPFVENHYETGLGVIFQALGCESQHIYETRMECEYLSRWMLYRTSRVKEVWLAMSCRL